MKAVFDTNVIVSGLLSPHSAPGLIVQLLASGKIKAYLDARVFSEYVEVLSRPKFKFDAALIAMFLDYLKHGGVFVASVPLDLSLPDEDDRMFYEVAVAGKVDCLVTGNGKHFPPCKKLKILSPAQFIEEFKRKVK